METFTVTKAIISDSKVIFKISSNNINNNINNKTNNKMETRNISLTLEEAREFYKSNNDTFKALALKIFTKEELECSFKNIKSFKDACHALNISYDTSSHIAAEIAVISKASAAMFKLNIIRTALNLNYNLDLVEDPKGSYIYYPINQFVTKNSPYKPEINSNTKGRILGKIENKGKKYYVLGGLAIFGCTHDGLGNFDSNSGIGVANFELAVLGCATKEIAQHFGKYFGMLITEAKYGDIPGFKVINPKYKI